MAKGIDSASWSAYLADAHELFEKGNYKEAEEKLKSNLGELQSVILHRESALVELLHMLANIHREQDEFEQADALYEQSLAALETDSLDELLPGLLRDYGLSLVFQGKFSEAYVLERRLFADAAAQDADEGEAFRSLRWLCALSLLRRDYENAARYYRLLLSSHLLPADFQHWPLVGDLASICFRLEDFGEAESLAMQALSQAEAQHAPDEELSGLKRTLALALCAQGRRSEARDICDSAAQLSAVAGTAPVLNDIADTYCCKGAFASAMPLCEEALSARELSMSESLDLPENLETCKVLLKRLNLTESTGRIASRIQRLKQSTNAAQPGGTA
jgi:tetratricopeptide (TPR) repeat protein